MKVTTVSSPHAVSTPTTNNQSQAEARDRAIAKLTGQGNQTNPTPVNPNQVQPEDFSAVIPKPNIQKPITEDNQQLSADEETTATQPQGPQQDKQLAALIRREKALRMQAHKQETALKAREAALAAKEAELAAKEKEYATGYIPKSKLKANTLQVLAEEEISYDTLTQQALEQQNVNPQVQANINKLLSKISDLESKVEQQAKATENQQQESYQAAIKQITRDATRLVSTDPAYETIKATKNVPEVVKLIEAHFQETGETLTVEEAAAEVEQELLERFEKYAKIPKVQQRLQPKKQEPTAPEQTLAPQKQPQPMKTLTNAAASTRQLSAKERALLAFEGKLK